MPSFLGHLFKLEPLFDSAPCDVRMSALSAGLVPDREMSALLVGLVRETTVNRTSDADQGTVFLAIDLHRQEAWIDRISGQYLNRILALFFRAAVFGSV